MAVSISKFRGFATVWADTSGVILPYVTVMLVVIVGVSVLAIDGARVMSLQTQLQRSADAFALAGAAELDQGSSSITRATNAINNTVSKARWREWETRPYRSRIFAFSRLCRRATRRPLGAAMSQPTRTLQNTSRLL